MNNGINKENYKLTAEEVCKKYPVMSKEDLMNLVESGHAPCVRHTITNNVYFSLSEIKNWLYENFVNYQGGSNLPNRFKVFSPFHEKAKQRPIQLINIDNIYEFNFNDYPPCIYFLTKENIIQYIGQTINLLARIGAHWRSEKTFDSVFFIPIPKNLLTQVETAFINFIKPPLNYTEKGFSTVSNEDVLLIESLTSKEFINQYKEKSP